MDEAEEEYLGIKEELCLTCALNQCVCLLTTVDKRIELLKLGEEIKKLKAEKQAAEKRLEENLKLRKLNLKRDIAPCTDSEEIILLPPPLPHLEKLSENYLSLSPPPHSLSPPQDKPLLPSSLPKPHPISLSLPQPDLAKNKAAEEAIHHQQVPPVKPLLPAPLPTQHPISPSLPQPARPSKSRASPMCKKSLPLGILQTSLSNSPSPTSSLLTTNNALIQPPSPPNHKSRLHGYTGVSSEDCMDIFDIDKEKADCSRSLSGINLRESLALGSPRPSGLPGPPAAPRRPWPPPRRSPERLPSETSSQKGSENPKKEKIKNEASKTTKNKPEPALTAPPRPSAATSPPELPPSSPSSPSQEPAGAKHQPAREQESREEKSETRIENKNGRRESQLPSTPPSKGPPYSPPPPPPTPSSSTSSGRGSPPARNSDYVGCPGQQLCKAQCRKT